MKATISSRAALQTDEPLIIAVDAGAAASVRAAQY